MKARFLALAALVLGLASCQNDFDGASVGVGGEVDFQLSVAVPEFGATRADEDGQNGHDSAYGAIDYLSDAEWENVDLRYTLEVYDLAAVNDPDAVPVKDRMTQVVDKYQPVSFDLRLVPGRDYRFVVFADFVDANGEGLHHTLGANLRQITVKNDMISQELTDAYFATLDVEELANNATGNIELTRPYGKVRVIATDLHELNLNVKAYKTVVTYDACHPGMFNAVTGAIDSIYEQEYYEVVYGDEAYSAYTVGYDDDKDSATDRLSHKTLFTDYILAPEKGQDAIHFTMSVYEKDGKLIKTTDFNTEIPVQRNYLTTVIGNVLTTATEINVTIDDNFKTPELKKDVVFVGTAAALQQALDSCAEGTTTILFDNDITGNVTVDQKEGVNIVISGNNYQYDGTITIDGNSRNNGTETLTIENINFFSERDGVDFIEQDSADSAVRYAHNVTIKNCSFNGVGNTSVGMRFRQCYNIVVENCVANGTTRSFGSGLHSLAQLNGCTNVRFDGISVNAKNGISFGTSIDCVVKDATIFAAGYGVRANASVATTLVLEDVSINANLPVVARKCSNAYVIDFNGTNELSAPGYDVVFTTGDDAEMFVAPDPAINFDVKDAEDFKVFPGDDKYAYEAASLQYFLDNANDGDVIKLAANIEGNVTATQEADVKVTIEGNGYDFAGYIVVNGKSAAYATAGLTIKNINFVAESIDADACIRLGDGNNATRYTNNVTVEGCTFNVPGAVGVKSYTGGDKNLKLDGCTATEVAHSLLQVANVEESVEVKDCVVKSKNGLNFNSSANVLIDNLTADVRGYAVRFGANSANGVAEAYTITNSTLKSACEESDDAVIILRGCADKAVLTLVNTTIEGPRQIINNVEGAEVSVDGASVVSDINAALAAGETNLYLTAGEYTIPAIQNKDVVISGSRNVVITVNQPNMSGANVVLNGVTVVGSGTYTGIQHVDTVTYNNVKVKGEMCLYGNEVDFNNCEFELAKGQYLWVYGCKNATFTNCKFYTEGKAILVYNEGAGANTVVVTGCEFNATAGDKAGAIANQNCAAIEIDNHQNSGVGAAHNVTASNNTYSDNFSGEWRIKNYVAGAAITVNDVAYDYIALDGKKMTIDTNKNVTVLE
ncbi:MAG: FimB/Mfa2 family fimbrial subunit [Alistipes sp.]|nr:FimB/Mfa2 family fimbrial subunit [Alistipes sp.]